MELKAMQCDFRTNGEKKKRTKREKMNLPSNGQNQYKTEVHIMFSNLLLQEHSNKYSNPHVSCFKPLQKQHYAVSF